MRKLLLIGVLVGVLLLATAAYVAAQDTPTPPAPDPNSDNPVVRGEYLVRIGFGCSECHAAPNSDGSLPQDLATADLTGGVKFTLPFGTVYASNLTLVHDWSTDDLTKAIRYGVDDEDIAMFPVMPFPLYESMSDQDMSDIVAYLQSQQPTGDEPPESDITDPSITSDMFRYPGTIDLTTPRPAPDATDPVARGSYLANEASCMHCHGQYDPKTFQVVPYPDGLPWGYQAPSLLPFHMSTVYSSPDQIKTALTTGVRPDGSQLASTMPWQLIAMWPSEDVDAIIAWIGSLPNPDASQNPNPSAAAPTPEAATATPAAPQLDGATLVQQRCTVCHSINRIESAHKDEAGWTATVDRMIGYGAQLNDQEKAAVIAYLVATY
jgi:mono/diheme cytochrome c family protein